MNCSIAHIFIAFFPFLIHALEHRNMQVHIIINLDKLLIRMEPMKTAGILLQGSLPGNRHGQKQRIQPRIIEAFPNITTGGVDKMGQPLLNEVSYL